MMNPEPKVDRMQQNLEQLFVGQNCDIILKVQDREFPVHKAILVAHSPVFSCMFSHNMAEKFSGVVCIPDCSAEAFEVFLLYLYTGRVNTISAENVCDVYYVADKYCIDDLKDHILQFLKANLSTEIWYDVFHLSVRHSDLELRRLAGNFFRKNGRRIVKSVQWKVHSAIDVHTLLKLAFEYLELL